MLTEQMLERTQRRGAHAHLRTDDRLDAVSAARRSLQFVAVHPYHQSNGIGAELMTHVGNELRQQGEEHARSIVVETSSTDQSGRTRSFYARIGYDEEARIRESYGPGDHKVVFWKQLN